MKLHTLSPRRRKNARAPQERRPRKYEDGAARRWRGPRWCGGSGGGGSGGAEDVHAESRPAGNLPAR